MKVETIVCDRCGERLEMPELSILTVKLPPSRNGRARDAKPPADLCPVCVVDLAAWLAAGPPVAA